MLGIVCDCEGLLAKRGTFISCTQCRKTYPLDELEQILKLMVLADREHDNDGKPANENVRRLALNKAASKLARLKLRVCEIQPQPPPQPVSPPPPPTYQSPFVTTTGTGFTGFVYNSPFGNVYIHVTFG